MLYNKKYFLLCLFFTILCSLTAVNAAKTTEDQDYFAIAAHSLQASKSKNVASADAIREANSVRKEVVALRAKIRKALSETEKNNLTQSADALTAKLTTLQDEGHNLREEKKALEQQALEYLEEGLIRHWGDKIHNRNPILMGDSTTLFFAHNTQFRSVHPNMLNKMGTALENRAGENSDMSLLLPALAGQNAPPELDISSFQLSREKQYFSHIEVKGDQSDPDSFLVPPNEIHSWLLMLSDLKGNPVDGANIEVVGHMPGHVHGLPTQPRITQELSPGTYLLEGVKFQMKGWWVMQFNIESGNNTPDTVTFNLVL